MIRFGFTGRDVIRSGWTFLAAFATVLATGDTLTTSTWIAASAAGLVAVKNLVLKDGHVVKG